MWGGARIYSIQWVAGIKKTGFRGTPPFLSLSTPLTHPTPWFLSSQGRSKVSEPAPSPSSEEAKSGCEPRCELRSRTDPMPPASLPPTQDAHASIHSLKTPQRTCKMPSARAAQAKRNFELGAPVHTRVWPFLGAAPAARRGFLDFCGNRSAWFLNGKVS